MTTSEFFARAQAEAVNDAGDPDAYWQLVSELHARDVGEVWKLVAPLATNADVRLQQLVPDILRKLGHEAQPLAAQTLELFVEMLEASPAPQLLASIANACVEFHDPLVVTLFAPHASHADESVRDGVLHAIRRSSRPEALEALMTLSRDPVDELREWATFALGSQLPIVDAPQVRAALAERLTDKHEATRDEAVIGLGLRGDARALGPLKAQFERGFVGVALFEAARALASPALLGALQELSRSSKVFDSLSEEERVELTAALAACSKP